MGKTDWNERYRQGEHAREEPHPLVLRFAPALTPALGPARALDIACGAGRHAVWLAERGWNVTAVDNSSVAIGILRSRSAGVRAVVADLERGEFLIEPDSYDLIVVCNYLQRDLFPSIRAGTRSGGLVICVIAMPDDDPSIRPMNPAYLINPGELRAQFPDWEILHDFEGKRPNRRRAAEIVARKTAAVA